MEYQHTYSIDRKVPGSSHFTYIQKYDSESYRRHLHESSKGYASWSHSGFCADSAAPPQQYAEAAQGKQPTRPGSQSIVSQTEQQLEASLDEGAVDPAKLPVQKSAAPPPANPPTVRITFTQTVIHVILINFRKADGRAMLQGVCFMRKCVDLLPNLHATEAASRSDWFSPKLLYNRHGATQPYHP